jgi:hypothetical protein
MSAMMWKDPAKTLDWIQALPEGEKREIYLERALRTGAMLARLPATPENAQLVVSLIAGLPIEAQERSAYMLGFNTGSQNVENVRVWLDRLSDTTTRAAAIEGAVKSRLRSQRDLIDVEPFIGSFPNGYERDAALRGAASVQSPRDGIQTVMKIANPEERFRALDQLVPEWLKRFPEEATPWLQTTNQIPAEWKKEWIR